MAGVDANWQGAFVGLFIVLAVLLQRIRGKRSAMSGEDRKPNTARREPDESLAFSVAAVALLATRAGAQAQGKKYTLRSRSEEHE